MHLQFHPFFLCVCVFVWLHICVYVCVFCNSIIGCTTKMLPVLLQVCIYTGITITGNNAPECYFFHTHTKNLMHNRIFMTTVQTKQIYHCSQQKINSVIFMHQTTIQLHFNEALQSNFTVYDHTTQGSESSRL